MLAPIIGASGAQMECSFGVQADRRRPVKEARGQVALKPYSPAANVKWPAAGLVDTEIRFSNPIGGFHAATSVQPGVQA
jgi:hypothetical protein